MPSLSPDRARTVALIVAAALFIQNLDSAIIATSLPQMGRDFGVEASRLSIGITTYILTSAAFVPLSAWIADRLGARNIFAGAIVLFVSASLACGLSHTIWTFAAARAVQGIGGALMAPVGRTVVLRNTEKAGLMQAIAFITWPALTAPVIGPLVGGLITSTIGWRWNFVINLPLGMIGLWLVWTFVPNLREPPRPLDLSSLAFTSGALAAVVYGLEILSRDPFQWRLPLMLLAAGALCGWAAWRSLTTARHPLLDPQAFRTPTFAATVLGAGMACRIGIAATPFLLPLLFQLIFGYSPLSAGLMIMAYFLGNLAIKVLTTPLLRRFGFRTLLVGSGLLSGAGIMVCAAFSPNTPALLMGLLLLVSGAARSTQFTALNTLSFADVPDAARGSASTISTMGLQLSGCLGVALAALVLALSRAARAATAQGLADFRAAFLVTGVLTFAGALWLLRLAPRVGEDVSGATSP